VTLETKAPAAIAVREPEAAPDLATHVVLVDEHDVERGTAPKLQAHREGWLHRACSVFVFDGARRLLLQRRAEGKYHSAGLWSNTCCGHPGPGEAPLQAAHRRLREEMGFDCPLRRCFPFVYEANVGQGLVEHEYDHVFLGWFNGDVVPNVDEVGDWKWEHLSTVRDDVAAHPDLYTAWFSMALPRVIDCAGIDRTT
jgi:isopentenyl-diphosphate Delta-isomerase